LGKTELVNYCAESCNITKKAATETIENIITVITDILASGNSISLPGFGTLNVKDTAARVGRNPKTGEEVKILASKKVTFKAGKNLKDAINS